MQLLVEARDGIMRTNKKLLILILFIVSISVSMIFFGCGSDSGDDIKDSISASTPMRPDRAEGIAVSPNGTFVFVADSGMNRIMAYKASPQVGDYDYVYVTNQGDQTILVFALDPVTGDLSTDENVIRTLSFKQEAPFLYAPLDVKVDPSGKFLYATGARGGKIESFFFININNPIFTSSGSVPGEPDQTPSGITVHPNSNYAYIYSWCTGPHCAGSRLDVYDIDKTTGALTRSSSVVPYGSAWPIVIIPSGNFAYLVGYDNASDSWFIVTYTVNSDTGALTDIDYTPIAESPLAVAIDPAGNFMFIVQENYISSYSIDSNTGTLTFVAGISTPFQNEHFFATAATDPQGKYLYVLLRNKLAWYSIDQETGKVSYLGDTSRGSNPTYIDFEIR
jgi:6-phosphogluconolactonase (cycloisomerase 2 family)